MFKEIGETIANARRAGDADKSMEILPLIVVAGPWSPGVHLARPPQRYLLG